MTARRNGTAQTSAAVRALGDFVAAQRRLAVLSGAGVSTASGISDYRDQNGEWKHARPIQYGDFIRNADARRRYWARSFVGWRRFRAAEPNNAHRALAALENAGRIERLITQNVDRLHTRAGSRRVIDLHGAVSRVRCLACGDVQDRGVFQDRLEAVNGDRDNGVVRYRPDGDAELAAGTYAGFSVPGCRRCDGIVKPDVVMFGEAVPRDRVAAARAAVRRADALLVVGSSLMVYSGFRFARQARELGKPIAIVNRGRTRADELATLRVDADCGAALAAAARGL